MENLSRFDRGLKEVSASSRANNLQKLMEKETESIRLWKVESQRRIEAQQREIQGKESIIHRLQKQLNVTESDKDEALASLRENEDKCQELVARLEKFSNKYQRILKGVAQREKDEQYMKEQHETLLEEKERLKGDLEEASQRFILIKGRIEAMKVEAENRLSQFRDDIRRRDDKIDEITAELAATKESQLLAIEKVSFLEQEIAKKSTNLLALQKEKESLISTQAVDKERLLTQIKEAEISKFTLERDLTDRTKELDRLRSDSERKISELKEVSEECSRQWSLKFDALAKEKGESDEKSRQGQVKVDELTAEIGRLKMDKRATEESLAASKLAHDQLVDEKGSLSEDLIRCRERLEVASSELVGKAAEALRLEESVGKSREEVSELNATLVESREKYAALDNQLRESEQQVLSLESRVQELQTDAKRYQSEILFQHETLQQREAEYANLSRKLKEIMEEKEGLEGEVTELKDSLESEKEAHAIAESAKDAALKSVESLGADLEKAKEQNDMYKEELQRALSEKSTFESDCIQLKMTKTSLQRQCEVVETKLKAIQEAEKKLRVEADRLREDKVAANNAEAKLKADVQKSASENQSEREKYDKVIDDIKAKHEEARKQAIDLEKQLLECRKSNEEQVKRHEKAAQEMEKDKEDVKKFYRGHYDLLNGQVAAEQKRLEMERKKVEAKDKELAVMADRVAALELETAKRSESACQDSQAVAAREAEDKKRIAELEAAQGKQTDKIKGLEKVHEEKIRGVEAEKKQAVEKWEKKANELRKEVDNLKLNLTLKEKECQGLKDREQALEREASKENHPENRNLANKTESVPFSASQPEVSVVTPSVSKSQQAQPSLGTPSLSQPTNISKNSTPMRTPRTLSKSWATPPSASVRSTPVINRAVVAPCTPSKSTTPPPANNSPFIRKRSTASQPLKINKKSKVTFGGTSSRVISDDAESQSADDSVHSDFLQGMPPPKTPKSAASAQLRSLSSASNADSKADSKTEKDKAKASDAAAASSGDVAVFPVVASESSSSNSSGQAASSSSSFVSDPLNPNVKMSKKFAELRAKNEKIREAKRLEREANKAKYGNKFNELKAKNEERRKRKEMEKAAAMAKAKAAAEDDDSSGCDWF